MGGAMGLVGCKHVVAAYERALADGAPSIGLWHSGGARLAEGVLSLHAVGRIFQAMTQASGTIPQISVVLAPAAGGAAYGPALTDIVVLGPAGRSSEERRVGKAGVIPLRSRPSRLTTKTNQKTPTK